MTKKTIIITGATAGIGLYSAMQLAEQNHQIILISRDAKKLDLMTFGLMRDYPDAAFKYFQADLSSMHDIRRVALEIANKVSHVDVLLNNAGGVFPSYKETADGYEYTFAFNHLSYFLLTGLLLPLLGKAEEPRIVNTSSKAHVGSRLHFDDIMHKQSFKPMEVYGESKLANLYFTYMLADKLKETNITVNALHPGVVRTNFGNEMPGLWKLLLPLLKKFFISPEEGAATSVYLASSPEVAGVNGAYFIKKKPVASSKISLETEPAEKLWALSEKLTGISYDSIIAALPKADIPVGEE